MVHKKIVAGTTSLKDGSHGLYTGLSQYTQGVSALGLGANKLNEGMEKYTGAVSLLKKGADGLYNGVYGYTGAVEGMHNGITALDQGAGVLSQGTTGLSEGTTKLNDGTKTLYQGMKVLNDNSDALLAAPDMMVEGLTQLKGGLSLVPSENQVKQLTDGSSAILTTLSKLSDGATAVDQGVETLKTTIHGLKEKAYSNESLNKYASMMEKNPTLVKLLLGALNEDQKTEIILGLLGVYSATKYGIRWGNNVQLKECKHYHQGYHKE